MGPPSKPRTASRDPTLGKPSARRSGHFQSGSDHPSAGYDPFGTKQCNDPIQGGQRWATILANARTAAHRQHTAAGELVRSNALVSVDELANDHEIPRHNANPKLSLQLGNGSHYSLHAILRPLIMEPSKHEQLLEIVSRFNAGALDIGRFQEEVFRLWQTQPWSWEELPQSLVRPITEFIDCFVSGYDPEAPPRRGLIGRVHDLWDATQGRYRVTEQQLRERALEVETLLRGTSKH